MRMKFELDEDELKTLKELVCEHGRLCTVKGSGAIGGRLTYTFTPTNMGYITKVECCCGEVFDLTDYDSW